MLRPGIITFAMLTDNPERLKKSMLLYDELWVPSLHKLLQAGPNEDADEEQVENIASIAWLAEQKFVKEPPFTMGSEQLKSDEVLKTLRTIYRNAEKSLEKVFRTPEAAARSAAAAIFNMEMSLTRAVAYVSWRDRKETAFPVIFPFLDKLAPDSAVSRSQQVLAIVLKRFPEPRHDLPLEDILAFRRDEATKYKFAKLWHWMQKLATSGQTSRELEEELDWLLTDYGFHIQQTSKTLRAEKLKALVTAPAEILENIVKFNFGKVAARLVDVENMRIAAHDAELKEPGNEIAYIKESIELLSKKH
jgi:hypothetical protein